MNDRNKITAARGLVALYLANDWNRIRVERGPPGTHWFQQHGVVVGLTGTNRGTVKRVVLLDKCIACPTAVNGSSTGDHIIPVSLGGTNALENYLPLCQSCNSSKGKRDLLDWWQCKDRDPLALPADVVTSYCRLEWRRVIDARKHLESAPQPLLWVLHALTDGMDDGCKRALWQRALDITGWKAA